LPAHYALPIMVVVHIPPDKKSALVDLFRARCAMQVREAEDKESLSAATIYFAPPDYHLLVETDKTLSLSSDEPVLFSRPSIDVLFESAADAFGAGLIAIVLTGANQDGARGLKAVFEAGGAAIIQNPDEAFAPAMPLAARAECPAARILSLAEIAVYLRGLGRT
jgi:two-component system chemotaxis response regulator CheB